MSVKSHILSPFIPQIRCPDFSHITAIRRRNMAAIKGKDTKLEILVRRMVYSMGYRYRLHVKKLPGTPDMVFPGRRKIIEIRGCFWHRHSGCNLAATPKTRRDFWEAKLQATVDRDTRNYFALRSSGWSVLVVWQCEANEPQLMKRLQSFLGPAGKKSAESL